MKKIIVALFALAAGCQNSPSDSVHRLDDWADAVVYFAMTDRFADGDHGNNDLGFGEYDTSREHSYHGGDFLGVSQQIAYLKSLGVNALWLTPPVENIVWSPDSAITGYHGYWASHFAKTDQHLGSLEDYQSLSAALKQQNMRLIQDVVTNHTGDFFTYQGEYNPEKYWENFRRRGAPEQPPFHQNNARILQHRNAAIYNFTPSIRNYEDSIQRLRWQMSDLDDLNTENPEVIAALKASFRFWIDSVGVDGFRFDTPLYVDHPFWRHFLYDSALNDRGMYPHARHQKKNDFYTFGETWTHSAPFDSSGEMKALRYLGSQEHPEMDGVLHFPMQQSIKRVFAEGAPTAELSYRMMLGERLFPEPWQKLHFIDNHDMPRLRSMTSEEATLQALAFILTIPGVPVIYYGTEQGLKSTRENLFGRYNPKSKSFLLLQQLIKMRNENAVFRRGKMAILADSKDQKGLLLYKLTLGSETKYVIFNTLSENILCGPLPVGKREGNLHILYQQGEVSLGAKQLGSIEQVRLGPHSFAVFEVIPATGTYANENANIRITNRPKQPYQTDTLSFTGESNGIDSLLIFFNGIERLSHPAKFNGTQWTIQLAIQNIPKGVHHLQWVGYNKGDVVLLQREKAITKLPQDTLAVVSDPKGDDVGPRKTYTYPLAFGKNRPGDLAGATLLRRGNSLQLNIQMVDDFSTVWNPPQGFDHVQFVVLLRIPQKLTTNLYAPLNYTLPSGSSFSHAFVFGGWGNQAFSVDGNGHLCPISSAPTVIKTKSNTLFINISPELLSFPEHLTPLELTVLTWDGAGEGSFRLLSPVAGDYSFGGGNSNEPKWMDRLRIKSP
jgi:glycosidase